MKKLFFALLFFPIFSGTSFATDNLKLTQIDSVLPETSLLFRVKEKNSGNPAADVNVKVVNNMTKESFEFKTNDKGEYSIILKDAKLYDKLNYNIVFSRKGYVTKSTGFDKILTQGGVYLIESVLTEEKSNAVVSSSSDKKAVNVNTKKGKKEYIIIVGSYKKPGFADFTIKDLKKQGYKVYSKSSGNFTRVGAYVSCDSESQLEIEKDKLRKKYPMDLWVLPETMQ